LDDIFLTGYHHDVTLNIKDPVTDQLARRLAEETGESITEATRVALEERLAKVTRRRPPAHDTLREIVARGRARADLDDRSPEEILGYDEHGLPS
jgi:antitoxin VapB